MAERLVLSDASPLIGLAVVGAFDLLRGLFGTVTVTVEVYREVTAGVDLPGARELEAATEAGWITVVEADSNPAIFPELDAGEASTLDLALSHLESCLVLMDEPLGRAQARALGIAVTGLAGILLAARQAGLVQSIRPLFDRLSQSDFRISNDLVRAVLEAAGEA